MLDRQQLADSDRVHIIETEQGLLIKPYDPDFEDAMDVYEERSKTYRNALRELAQ